MRQWIALCLCCLPLAALELSIQTGKEEGRPYSILHLSDPSPFNCEATKDEFGETKRVDCRFSLSPRRPFEPINNANLIVSASSSASGYVVSVTPKAKMKLVPMVFNLSREPQTYGYDVKISRHWTVIGYTGNLPMIKTAAPSASAINFPIKIDRNINPYVGGLDLHGNPIKIARVQDVTDYMEMKKAYTLKDYDKVLDLAESTLKNYPKTVFKNELMLYQIRAYHEKEEHEKLLEVSKQFLRNYASDPNVAEVLAYTANAYTKIGQTADADYFYDRLFEEQSESPFASLGMIYKAQQYEGGGEIKKASDYYQKALNTSSDVEIASRAAFRLAQIALKAGDAKQAKPYIDKIASANPKYFVRVREDALAMAEGFLGRNDALTASKITEALYNAASAQSPEKEKLLKDLGLQLAKANKREDALKRFNEYLKQYKYGDYVAEVQKAKDGLFFEADEHNATAEIKKYNDLIERYGNDTVGQKALYKKAQLLVQEGKYKELLDMESDLYRLDSVQFPEIGSMISKSAIGMEKAHLKAGKCAEAMELQKMYSIKLLPEWDAMLFDCSLKTTKYDLAKTIAKRHLSSKSIPERELWLYRMVQTQFGLGEYAQAIKGGNELVTLLGAEKNPALNEVHRILFDAAQRLNDEEKMIRYIKGIEGTFGEDFKDIERYTQMVSLALKRKDEAMVQNYARKVMVLQKRTKTYTQTPFIEFTLAQSYQNLGKDAQALEVLRSLDARKLNAEKRSRQQYLIGSLAQKLGRNTEARTAFNASVKADAASAWGKLAKEALGLL